MRQSYWEDLHSLKALSQMLFLSKLGKGLSQKERSNCLLEKASLKKEKREKVTGKLNIKNISIEYTYAN